MAYAIARLALGLQLHYVTWISLLTLGLGMLASSDSTLLSATAACTRVRRPADL